MYNYQHNNLPQGLDSMFIKKKPMKSTTIIQGIIMTMLSNVWDKYR